MRNNEISSENSYTIYHSDDVLWQSSFVGTNIRREEYPQNAISERYNLRPGQIHCEPLPMLAAVA
jgi:hypothetical protein